MEGSYECTQFPTTHLNTIEDWLRREVAKTLDSMTVPYEDTLGTFLEPLMCYQRGREQSNASFKPGHKIENRASSKQEECHIQMTNMQPKDVLIRSVLKSKLEVSAEKRNDRQLESSPMSTCGPCRCKNCFQSEGWGIFRTPPGTDKEVYCGFCRSNRFDEMVVKSHRMRSNNKIVCPVLRNMVCGICKATGDSAHTIKYCPFNPVGFLAKRSSAGPGNEEGLPKVVNILPQAMFNSYGRIGVSRDSSLAKQFSTHRIDEKRERLHCPFCKSNGSDERFYSSHQMRMNGKVVCPVLRTFVCFLCHATGDNAHTIKYCPINKRGFYATGNNKVPESGVSENRSGRSAFTVVASKQNLSYAQRNQAFVAGTMESLRHVNQVEGRQQVFQFYPKAVDEDFVPIPLSSAVSYPKFFRDEPTCAPASSKRRPHECFSFVHQQS